MKPVTYNHDIDTSNEIASEALEHMHAHKLCPSPNNFEVWYVYFGNMLPDLRAIAGKLVASKKKLTQADCDDLYTKFLSEQRNEDLYKRAGDQIHSTLQDVSGLMTNVRSATSEYTENLVSVGNKLGKAATPEDFERILQTVAKDTERMVTHNKKLEEQLERSSCALEELKKDLEKVRREAMTDGLTGLSNRKSFDEQILRLTQESDKEGKTYALLMLDIDHFKSFNDNYGHQVGDQVLRLVARTVIEGVKGRDLAARYGGEEFVIVLPDTNLQAAFAVGENLRKAVATKEVINRSTGEKLGRITMSVGIAQYVNGESIEDIIGRADAALYTAKHNGRNQVAAAPTPTIIKKNR